MPVNRVTNCLHMKSLLRDDFNRKYVLIPVLVVVVGGVCALAAIQVRHVYHQHLDEILVEHEGRSRAVAATLGTAEPTGLGVLLASEPERLPTSFLSWKSAERMGAKMAEGAVLLSLLLAITFGLRATREITRKGRQNGELEALVRTRTAELQLLSEHMVRMIEVERATLARELHDELGGLLVAMRMDLSRLRKCAGFVDADSLVRWTRLDAALVAGIELKRRVIENLRPTLLDNMGLVSAIRWQVEQSCMQAQIQLRLALPASEVPLEPDVEIAVFRTVQEAMANIIKHSRARSVSLSMTWDQSVMELFLDDDGVGMPPDAFGRTGSHGLLQMKFRMRAAGGSIKLQPSVAGGVRVSLRLPAATSTTAWKAA
jgi:signal transduction histidine kinase